MAKPGWRPTATSIDRATTLLWHASVGMPLGFVVLAVVVAATWFVSPINHHTPYSAAAITVVICLASAAVWRRFAVIALAACVPSVVLLVAWAVAGVSPQWRSFLDGTGYSA